MSDSDGSFEKRLRDAQQRQAKPPASSAGAGRASPMGIGVRVGAELVAALVVAVAIGWGLDRWLGTMPLFTALFVLLGGAAGVANVWRMMLPPKRRKD